MGGGLLQLVAYGAQDVYLTGNPQITFFKVVYRRHTNFAMEAIQQTFSGITAFGNTVYCQISRNGDLIHRTYVEVTLPPISTGSGANALDRYVNYVGLKLLKTVTLEIGGQQIDKHYSDWLYIWNELSLPLGKKDGWNYMVGADQDVTSFPDTQTTGNPQSTQGKKLFIPLEFWFCRNIGLALPLIALQYHEVKIKIEFDTLSNCVYGLANSSSTTTQAASSGTLSKLNTLNVNMWVDYIFLDTDERRRFAQLSHEYLIEQLQFTGSENLNSGYNRIKLNFNHPCKELIWVAKLSSQTTVNQWYNYTLDASTSTPAVPTAQTSFYYPSVPTIYDEYHSSGTDPNANTNVLANITPGNYTSLNPFASGLLQLNGNDRFQEREGTYFNYVQPYQHHTNISLNKGINVYSFAIKPEEHQPSGTLNMSRIDTAVLSVAVNPNISSLTNATINVYAVNYNVLRILSGMGGLAYSN